MPVLYLILKSFISWETPLSQAYQEDWSPRLGRIKCRLGMCDSFLEVLKDSGLQTNCVSMCVFIFTSLSFWHILGSGTQSIYSALYIFFFTCKINGHNRGRGWELYPFLNVFTYFYHLKIFYEIVIWNLCFSVSL